jgi:hypothetical protein
MTLRRCLADVRGGALLSRYGSVMTAPAPPPMAHRSWYMNRVLADRLAATVDDIHFRTRRPKHEVLGAAVAVALEHEADIVARLAEDIAR